MMSNPLFGMMQQQTPVDGLMRRFQQFKQAFTGDPRQRVQEMLNSGQISQQQYNQAVKMAQQFQRMMKG